MFSPEYANLQLRIDNEKNIMMDIVNSINKYKKIASDNTRYPTDQESLLRMEFPHMGSRNVPTVEYPEYMKVLGHYILTGNLLAVRYIGPDDNYIEVLLFDPNEKGNIWLIIFSPELTKIEEVRLYIFESF
jgi:hypothetical protein